MKLKGAYKKWHKKALMIDTRKTMLVLESLDVKPETIPPLIRSEPVETEQAPSAMDKSQPNPSAQELSATYNADWLADIHVDNWWGGFRC